MKCKAIKVDSRKENTMFGVFKRIACGETTVDDVNLISWIIAFAVVAGFFLGVLIAFIGV